MIIIIIIVYIHIYIYIYPGRTSRPSSARSTLGTAPRATAYTDLLL